MTSKKRGLCLASRMHIRVFFELVFSMTASSECHVSHVFSAFMRKATHISAGEDSVLQTAKKRRKQRKGRGFWLILGPKSPPKWGSFAFLENPLLLSQTP